MKYKVFGCKVNKYYTDEWLNSEYLKDKNGIFIASCVVTDKAKRKWLKFVKQEIPLLKDKEKIYISGCGAFEKGGENKKFYEIYTELEEFKNLIEILPKSPKVETKYILSGENKETKNILSGENKETKNILSGENKETKNILSLQDNKIKNIGSLPKLNLTTKKFLLIQGGCDSFCTFCLTVIKRGKHFYRAKEDIVDEITEFEMSGGKEIVLTGINLGAWGLESTNDYKNSLFGDLLEYILEKTEIQRIRISSLGPEFVDDKVLKLFENERIYPHFHYSIQSGSSKILSSMRRHYDGIYIRDLLNKTSSIKRQDGIKVSIGADIIVGFPGEEQKDFEDTLDLVKNYNITKLHAFPFSNHTFGEHVPASFYPNQVEESIKKQRMDLLLNTGEEARNNFILSQKGKTLKVLIESTKDNNFKGWSQNYIECSNNNFEIISGKIAKNEIITGILK